MSKLVNVPASVLVYDSGPSFYDRLMVVYPDGAVFTTPLNEDNFFQYEGEFQNIDVANSKQLNSVPNYVLSRINQMMP